jgi:hypothetical protein
MANQFEPIYDFTGQNIIGYTDVTTGQQTLFGATGQQYTQEPEYYPPPRPAKDPMFAPEDWSPSYSPARGAIYDSYLYGGPGIVDTATGNIKLFDQQGNPRFYRYEDATDEFYSMPAARRDAIMDYLDGQGFDVGDTVSAISSMWKVMQLANNRGIDYEQTMMELSKYGAKKTPVAPVYRVTAAADLRAVANEVAKQTMGRELTEDEAARFVTERQQAEVSYQQGGAGMIEQLPNVSVAAEGFAQSAAPTETAAYTYLGKVNKLMGMLGAV